VVRVFRGCPSIEVRFLPRHQAKKPPMLFPAAMRLRATNRPSVDHAEQPKPELVEFANHVLFLSRVSCISRLISAFQLFRFPLFAFSLNSLSSRVTQVFQRCSEISPRPLQSVHLSGSWP
jgi:hypothetical protein